MPSNKHILIVDDEAAYRQMLSELLGGLNYTIDVAVDGEQAVKMASRSDYDLVITDLSLPKLSGTQVLAAVKRDHPDTPVIMITGYATADTAVEAMKLGA